METKINLLMLILIISCSAEINTVKGQITLDTIVTPWNGFGYDFYPVQISSTETKYLWEDTLTNTFSLYNMDFSPFMLSIAVPEPFAPFINQYEVIYVSRSLFDCDTSNIEYAYAAQAGSARTFYIMRTDGTQLFRLDSAVAPYCFGCLNGSDEMRPIRNTSSGAKLFLHHPLLGQTTRIYSLCGTLPESTFDFTNSNFNQSQVKIFPNPSSGTLIFKIDLPDNMNDYELVIVDNDSKEMKREKIHSGNNKYEVDIASLSNGTYLYSLCTKNKSFKSGKFLLTK